MIALFALVAALSAPQCQLTKANSGLRQCHSAEYVPSDVTVPPTGVSRSNCRQMAEYLCTRTDGSAYFLEK